MREMRDSGIEWLGNIPANWGVVYPKALFSQRKDRATEGDRQLTASQQHGVVYQDEYMAMTGSRVVVVLKDFDILKHVEAGDFVISMRSFQGGIEYSENTGCISSAYVMLMPNNDLVFPGYYKWLLKSSTYINALQSTSNLVRDGQAMRYINFIQVYLPLVPIDEQQIIAKKLDKKCTQIDALITNEQKQIEKLKQYKQSLITEIVTKGLDLSAPMKDSGVEWMGRMPTAWEIISIKQLGTARNGLTYTPADVCDSSTGLLVLRSSNIKNGRLCFDDNVYVHCPIKEQLLVKEGDILICSRNGSKKLIGKNAIIEEEIKASFGAFMMVFRSEYNPKYIKYILDSAVFSYYLGTFLTATINQLTGANFYSMRIPFTYSKEEQVKIVRFLDEKCSRIDELLTIKQSKIDKLNAYKKSLIYEYVTGKKEAAV